MEGSYRRLKWPKVAPPEERGLPREPKTKGF